MKPLYLLILLFVTYMLPGQTLDIGGGAVNCNNNCDLPCRTNTSVVVSVPAGSTIIIDGITGNACSGNGETFESGETITMSYSTGSLSLGSPASPNLVCVQNNSPTAQNFTFSANTNRMDEVARIDYTINNSACATKVLPIQLAFFTARPILGRVMLDWRTLSELNNDYFSIERSIDGSEFYEIAKIYGQGSTDAQHDYTYTDARPLKGNNYYRLKQYDFDHQSSVSNTELVKIDNIEMKVYPSVFDQSINIELAAGNKTSWNYTLHNLQSQIIIQSNLNHSTTIELQSVKIPGIYFLQLKSANETKSFKLIKL